MTFKQFRDWCNQRSADGRWGCIEAMACVSLIDEINKVCFWKRENVWKEKHEKQILDEIVNPINKMIEVYSKKNTVKIQ